MTLRPGDRVRFSDDFLRNELGLSRETVSGWTVGTVLVVARGQAKVRWSEDVEDTTPVGTLEQVLRATFSAPPTVEAK